jgi:hypothetical protein
MVTHFKNRLLAVSLALASAGILTCLASVLELFFPRGSLLAFIGWMCTAGIAVVAVTLGFAWTSEKVDEWRTARQGDRDLRAEESPRAETSARDGRPAALSDCAPRPVALFVSPRLHYYPLTLQRARPLVDLPSARTGRGQ